MMCQRYGGVVERGNVNMKNEKELYTIVMNNNVIRYDVYVGTVCV